MVFQRKMSVEALQTKALLTALVNPEKADEAARAYFELVVPVSDEDRKREEWRREAELREVEEMDPIPISQFEFGKPIGDLGVSSSMHRP